MDENNKLGLLVSYYLSRFDKEGYKNLAMGKQAQTHKKIGELLNTKASTIKNWRDEFDPLFGHRAGWYQRPMIASRVSVVQAMENLDEPAVRAIVLDILTGKLTNDDEKKQLLSIIQNDNKKKDTTLFILRGPTGRKAEDFFINHFKSNRLPSQGDLIDCRELGAGYDFKIQSGSSSIYVEVKGLAEKTGGIAFTNKEWHTAKRERNNYYLCIVSDLNNNPAIKFVQDPFSKLSAKKSIYTTIQISWGVSPKQLSKL